MVEYIILGKTDNDIPLIQYEFFKSLIDNSCTFLKLYSITFLYNTTQSLINLNTTKSLNLKINFQSSIQFKKTVFGQIT